MLATTVDELLASPLMKLMWAREHERRLRAEVASYFARAPFEMVGHYNPNTGETRFTAEERIPIPDTLRLIAGDALHNARSALDHLAWGLVGDVAQRPRRVQFPNLHNTTDPAAIQRERERCQLSALPDPVFTALVAAIQGPDGATISALHNLDIADKHRLLLFFQRTLGATPDELGNTTLRGTGQLRLVGPNSAFIFTGPPAPRRERRAAANLLPLRPVPCHFPVTFDIIFGDGEPGYPEPVSDYVFSTIESVERVIRRIAASAF